MIVVVLESIDKNGNKEFGISFTNSNPKINDYIKCVSEKNAYSLQKLITSNAKELLRQFWNSESDKCPLECTEAELQEEQFERFVISFNPNFNHKGNNS